MQRKCVYDYQHSCTCAEDDNCGCDYDNNMAGDFSCNFDERLMVKKQIAPKKMVSKEQSLMK